MRLIFPMNKLLLNYYLLKGQSPRSQLSSLYEWASLSVAVPCPRQGETEARKHLRKPDTHVFCGVILSYGKLCNLIIFFTKWHVLA